MPVADLQNNDIMSADSVKPNIENHTNETEIIEINNSRKSDDTEIPFNNNVEIDEV